MRISDPTSPNYGQHMSHKEVHEMSKNLDATNAILKYCKKHQLKINKISEYGEYIYVMSTTIKLDELFST